MTDEFRPGREARRRRLATRRGRRAATTGVPLALRRILVAALVAFLGAITFSLPGIVNEVFAEDAALAATAPRSTGTIVDAHYEGRGGWDYDITVNGRTHWLDYYWILPGELAIGDRVEIVVDPFDTDRAIAVGTAGDWVPDPTEAVVAFLCALGLSAYSTGLAAKHLLPEDVERILDIGKPDHQL